MPCWRSNSLVESGNLLFPCRAEERVSNPCWTVFVNKTLSLLLLVVLLIVGLAAGYVVNDPAATKSLLGMSQAQAQETGPAAAEQGPRAENAAAETEPAQGEKPADGFDRKASGQADKRPEGRRPPTREEFEKRMVEDLPQIETTRKAREVGSVDDVPATEPPAPESYPIDIIRRTYPDARSMTVEIAIKNASGTHWKTAYVTLRSPQFEGGQLFEIDDWRIDEVVSLDYTFPRGEVDDRIKFLRVAAVNGNERESALANLLAANRQRLIEKTGGGDPLQARRGDVLSAPGLLSYLGNFQQPFTGIKITTTDMRAAPKKHLDIVIPQDQMLPETFQTPVRETSEERREVANMTEEFHKSGLKVQQAIKDFVAAVDASSYEEAIKGEAAGALNRLRSGLAEFNEIGVALATRVQRSSDPEIKQVRGIVIDYSGKIVSQVKALEESIHTIDERFRVET